jgi:hypothetical protein
LLPSEDGEKRKKSNMSNAHDDSLLLASEHNEISSDSHSAGTKESLLMGEELEMSFSVIAENEQRV